MGFKIATIVLSGSKFDNNSKRFYVEESLCKYYDKNYVWSFDQSTFIIRNLQELTFEKYYNSYFDKNKNISEQLAVERMTGKNIVVSNYYLMFAIYLLLSRINVNVFIQPSLQKMFMEQVLDKEIKYNYFVEKILKVIPAAVDKPKSSEVEQISLF